ncbi:MAG: hypothetical protein WBA22_11230 [Candidatus Methanofastidiosia archaeon]
MGNLTSFTDCNGNETTYTYDSIYRLTQIRYEDSSTVSFAYDLNGKSTQMDDNVPGTGDYAEYHYDCWNRLTSETRHISESSYTIFYQYDTANRITEPTYPDDMQILYSFDDLNRITEIKRYVDGSNDERKWVFHLLGSLHFFLSIHIPLLPQCTNPWSLSDQGICISYGNSVVFFQKQLMITGLRYLLIIVFL